MQLYIHVYRATTSQHYPALPDSSLLSPCLLLFLAVLAFSILLFFAAILLLLPSPPPPPPHVASTFSRRPSIIVWCTLRAFWRKRGRIS